MTEHQPKPRENKVPEQELSRPSTAEYGLLVDRMVETVRSWPPEYQRSVDIHGSDSAASSSDITEASA